MLKDVKYWGICGKVCNFVIKIRDMKIDELNIVKGDSDIDIILSELENQRELGIRAIIAARYVGGFPDKGVRLDIDFINHVHAERRNQIFSLYGNGGKELFC